MDFCLPPDREAELAELSASFRAVLDNLIQTTQNGQNEPILKVAQTADVPSLAEMSMPGTAHAPDQVIQEAFKIFDYRVRMNHRHFFGFIPSPTSPYSWLGECLSSAFNTFAGSKLQGSGPAVVEKTLLQWLASRAGLPVTSGGVFVSGGSMANMTAMILARDCILPDGKENLGVAYLSDQTHHSVSKALRLIGFKTHQIRRVPSDSAFKFHVTALREAIQADRAAGLIPFVVVATSGTTNTGSIDPLVALAQVRDEEGLWLHVDGAYGASASLSATRSSTVDGLGLADSISWDAHKWLFQTYSCGLLLVREKLNLTKSFTNDGDYLRDALEDEDLPNFWNFGMELTRPARAMKLWFTLRVLGVEKLGQMIDHGIKLAERAQKELEKLPGWEITSPASLAIVTFRYAPPGRSEEELDSLNAAISRTLLESNAAGMLTTKLRGKVVIRICSISPLLSENGMVEVIRQADAVAKKLDQNMLPN